MHGSVLNKERLDYTELLSILVTDVKGEYLAKRTKNGKVLVNWIDTEVEKIDDYGCPRIRLIVDRKADGEKWISSNYPLRHKTSLHSTERHGKLIVNWTRQHLSL